MTNSDKPGTPVSNDVTKLLLEDLKHFSDSFWRNEEAGEKRFNFFVTLITAVAAGLATLHTAKDLAPHVDRGLITWYALLGLLLFGIMIYLRMLQRIRVKKEHQATLRYIRRKLLELTGGPEDYFVPRNPFVAVRQETERPLADAAGAKPQVNWRRVPHLASRGSLAVLVGLIDTVLVGALLMMWSGSIAYAGIAGVGSLALFWAWAVYEEGLPSTMATSEYFRAGAGAIILNAEGAVLALERQQIPGAWQLPQGGLARSENPLAAAYREVEEETGISPADLHLLDENPVLLAYELPLESRTEKTGRGQVNYWFIFQFDGQTSSINLTAGGEFRNSAWMPFEQLMERVVRFRKPVYKRLAEHFRAHLLRESSRS